MATESPTEGSPGSAGANHLRLLPEALFIAALTACSYWYAFQYELGFFGGFGLPAILLEINLQIILIFAAGFVAITSMWFWIINPLVLWWPTGPDLKRKIAPFGIALLFAVWYGVAFGFRIQDYVVYLILGGLGLVFSGLEFLPKTSQTATGVDWMISTLGNSVTRAVFFFIALNSLASLTGMSAAQRQKDFLVPADNPNSAVIRIYNDKIIAVSFDRKAKTLTGDVLVWKLDKENLKLTLEKNIGPLSPKRNTTPTQPVLQKTPPPK